MKAMKKADNLQLIIITFFYIYIISRPCFITKNPSCVTGACREEKWEIKAHALINPSNVSFSQLAEVFVNKFHTSFQIERNIRFDTM